MQKEPRLVLGECQVIVLGEVVHVRTLTPEEASALTALEERRTHPPRQAVPLGWSEWVW